MEFYLTAFGPIIACVALAIATQAGFSRVSAAAIAAVILVLSAVQLTRGVAQSCGIDQSECLGAQASALLVAFGWLVGIALLAVAYFGAASRERRQAAGR